MDSFDYYSKDGEYEIQQEEREKAEYLRRKEKYGREEDAHLKEQLEKARQALRAISNWAWSVNRIGTPIPLEAISTFRYLAARGLEGE